MSGIWRDPVKSLTKGTAVRLDYLLVGRRPERAYMRREILLSGLMLIALSAPALATDLLDRSAPLAALRPASSPPSIQATAEASGGYGQMDSFFSTDFGEFDAAGRVNIPFSSEWNLQADVQGSNVNYDVGSQSYTNIEGFLHLYKRTPTHAFGAYFGAGQPNYRGSSFDVIGGGLEGQIYLQNFTLYGQAGLSQIQVPFGASDVHTAMLRGEIQAFFGDNTMVAADAMWNRISATWGDFDATTAALSAVHRVAGTPFAVTGQARYDRVSDGYGFDTTTWTALAGIKLFADPPGSTVRSSHQTGPAMDVLAQTPSQFEYLLPVSDMRLKRDIQLVGHLPNGLGLYRYRYLWSDTVYVGVMAQEVATVIPAAAVIASDGFYRVNYALLGTHLMTWDQWLAAEAGPSALASRAGLAAAVVAP